jgi:lysozyme
MKTTKILFNKVREFEGCRLEAYQDAAGVWTIGYGHTRRVLRGDRISRYLADDYLRCDLAQTERQVLALGVAETQGQLDALVSFAFNMGIGRLKASTLLKVISVGGSEANIRAEFMRWVYADGKKLAGLVRRRRWETDRYFEESPRLEELTNENEDENEKADK